MQPPAYFIFQNKTVDLGRKPPGVVGESPWEVTRYFEKIMPDYEPPESTHAGPAYHAGSRSGSRRKSQGALVASAGGP